MRRAQRIAGELLHGIGGLSIPWEQHTIRVGVSIGIASIRAGMSVDEAVAAADVQSLEIVSKSGIVLRHRHCPPHEC